jgi:hypothetical protein
MSILDKLRKAREVNVEAGGKQFTIRRPTDEEALRIGRDDTDMLGIVKRFTVGWDLTELDVIPGGTGAKLPFDAELFGEWVADQPAVWEPLAQAIMDAYKAHADKRDAAVKN